MADTMKLPGLVAGVEPPVQLTHTGRKEVSTGNAALRWGLTRTWPAARSSTRLPRHRHPPNNAKHAKSMPPSPMCVTADACCVTYATTQRHAHAAHGVPPNQTTARVTLGLGNFLRGGFVEVHVLYQDQHCLPPGSDDNASTMGILDYPPARLADDPYLRLGCFIAALSGARELLDVMKPWRLVWGCHGWPFSVGTVTIRALVRHLM